MTQRSRAPDDLSPRPRALVLAVTLLALAQLACAGVELVVGGPAVHETVAGQWIHVYFTDPGPSGEEGHRHSSLVQGFISAIDQAEETIDLAAYDFDLKNITASLIAAERRGVRVRVVTEGENVPDNRDVLIDLQRAGIPVIEDLREGGLMHNKFAVIDEAWIWTGSWNLTENGTYRNNNNAVLITSPALAENYTAEFEEMVARQSGPVSPVDTPNPHVIVTSEVEGEARHRVDVENHFAPEDRVAEEIIAEIEAAEERIRFLAFVFTSEEIVDALVKRSQAGVVVQGVIEDRSADQSHSQYDRLRAAFHDVLLDGNPYIMHHKVIIIDDETVITGSYNFTHSAETRNDENVLIIHDPVVAELFVEEFGRVYEEARNAE